MLKGNLLRSLSLTNCVDMKNLGNSHNEWMPTYGDLKSVVGNCHFLEEDFEDGVENRFLIAYV